MEELKKTQALNAKAQKKKKRLGSGNTAGKSSGVSSTVASEQDLNKLDIMNVKNVMKVNNGTGQVTVNGQEAAVNSITAIKIQTDL